jgi:hypothetical protein
MSYDNFIKKQIIKYKNLDPIYCKVLGEMVFFNSEGIHHLLYKKRRPRSCSERVYRLHLIDYLQDGISKSISARRQDYPKNNLIIWSLNWVDLTNRKKEIISVKIILKKKGEGKLLFYSVMRKRKIKKPRKI